MQIERKFLALFSNVSFTTATSACIFTEMLLFSTLIFGLVSSDNVFYGVISGKQASRRPTNHGRCGKCIAQITISIQRASLFSHLENIFINSSENLTNSNVSGEVILGTENSGNILAAAKARRLAEELSARPDPICNGAKGLLHRP